MKLLELTQMGGQAITVNPARIVAFYNTGNGVALHLDGGGIEGSLVLSIDTTVEALKSKLQSL